MNVLNKLKSKKDTVHPSAKPTAESTLPTNNKQEEEPCPLDGTDLDEVNIADYY